MRAVALIAAPVGRRFGWFDAYVGRHNPSPILKLLFVLWVVSPFVTLVFASGFGKHWPAMTRTALYSLTFALTLGSLGIYSCIALGLPG
jgi:hypothetical protein